MAKSAFLAEPRTDWRAVAREVSRRLKKDYAGQYVRDVAGGWRANAAVTRILQELGLVKSKRAVAA